jgi:hypothetical protein
MAIGTRIPITLLRRQKPSRAVIGNGQTISIITAGTSGEDTTWTQQLAWDLEQPTPPNRAPIAGFGCVAVSNAASSVQDMQTAAGPTMWPNAGCGNQTCIYVTEIGESNAANLTNEIENLNNVTLR